MSAGFDRERALALALLVSSCTLTRPEVTECSSSARCQKVFGAGFVCNADGFCEQAPKSKRCSETFPDDLLIRPQSYPNAILIGNLMDRSVASQTQRENAVRLAAMQAREQGGLDDRPFGVVFCDIAKKSDYDSLERTAAAVRSARYLVESIGVPLIIGPSSSDDTLAVFASVEDSGTVVITPSATSPMLTSYETPFPTDEEPGLLWRTTPPDTIQGLAIAKYLSDLAIPSIEVVSEVGAYGEGLSGTLVAKFIGTATLTTFSTTSERDAAVVSAGKSTAPWVVFVSSQTSDVAAFLNAAVTIAEYGTKNIFLTDSAANSDLLQSAKPAMALFPRIKGSRPAVPKGPVYDQFRASFNAAFKVDANAFSFVAHSYDAAWLAFYGAAWSSTQENAIYGAGIARGLRHVSAGSPIDLLPANWESGVEEFRAGRGIDVLGASGELDYLPSSEETTGPTEIWKISASGSSIQIEDTIAP